MKTNCKCKNMFRVGSKTIDDVVESYRTGDNKLYYMKSGAVLTPKEAERDITSPVYYQDVIEETLSNGYDVVDEHDDHYKLMDDMHYNGDSEPGYWTCHAIESNSEWSDVYGVEDDFVKVYEIKWYSDLNTSLEDIDLDDPDEIIEAGIMKLFGDDERII